MTRPKEVRQAVGMSCSAVAKLAGRNRHTLRVYEANPEAVDDDVRAELDAVYGKLGELLRLNGPVITSAVVE
jgi:hypothetical protein